MTSWDDLVPFQEPWNRLVKRSATSTLFQTYEWHQSWWESFGEDYQLRVLLAEENGKLVGVAPLVLCRRTYNLLPEVVLSFLGSLNYASDYCDWIVPKERTDVFEAFLSWLTEQSHEWSMLHLHNVPAHSFWSERIQKWWAEHNIPFAVVGTIEAPTRLLALEPHSDRKIANKKSLRRHLNYFRRNGTIEFLHLDSLEEIEGWLEHFFAQHIERRALAGDTSMFVDSKQRAFYRTMIRRLLPTGWLRFSVLLFDKKPLAFHCGFEYNRCFLWYKPTFNVAYAQKSPGEVLIKFLLEDAMERELAEFDFTVGTEAFKYRFSNKVRSNLTMHVYRQKRSYYMVRLRALVGRVVRFTREIGGAQTRKSGRSNGG